MKEKLSALLVVALEDTVLRVEVAKIGELLEMLKMLDNHFVSSKTASRILVLTSVYNKQYICKQDNMATFVNEFEYLLAQLEKMDAETKISEFHSAPLLLVAMENSSTRESTVASRRTKEANKLSWEEVTSDLTQNWN